MEDLGRDFHRCEDVGLRTHGPPSTIKSHLLLFSVICSLGNHQMLFDRIFIVPEPNVSQNTWCFGDLNDVSLGKNLAPNSNLFDMNVEFGVDIATSFIAVYPPQPPCPPRPPCPLVPLDSPQPPCSPQPPQPIPFTRVSNGCAVG